MVTDMIIASFGNLCSFLDCWLGHGGKPNTGTPPHRPSFPTIENAVALRNIPASGTSPIKLLKDRLRYVRREKLPRNSGIIPDRLLDERSSS
uniref:Uncharacterized protein n=1 Tax=Arundo donax TaxID=35708 RepID=A0A0A9F5B8_ARUDO